MYDPSLPSIPGLLPVAAVIKEDEATYPCVFPADVRLTITSGVVVGFRRGVHPVPEHLIDHWYLKASKVELYKATQSNLIPPNATPGQYEKLSDGSPVPQGETAEQLAARLADQQALIDAQKGNEDAALLAGLEKSKAKTPKKA